jgi:hypothetical protein
MTDAITRHTRPAAGCGRSCAGLHTGYLRSLRARAGYAGGLAMRPVSVMRPCHRHRRFCRRRRGASGIRRWGRPRCGIGQEWSAQVLLEPPTWRMRLGKGDGVAWVGDGSLAACHGAQEAPGPTGSWRVGPSGESGATSCRAVVGGDASVSAWAFGAPPPEPLGDGERAEREPSAEEGRRRHDMEARRSSATTSSRPPALPQVTEPSRTTPAVPTHGNATTTQGNIGSPPVKFSGMIEEMIEDPDAEAEALDRNPFVHAMEHSGKVQIWG